MTSALIGHTGFVGSNLARQMQFDEFYNSKNIDEIRGREFDLVVCAGMPGSKWLANEKPEEDRDAIVRLLSAMRDISVVEIVLISTIDAILRQDQYGNNRVYAEAVLRCYQEPRVIRLPALFGPGLKKNALYDLMHAERLERIAPNATYQWYPLRRLGADIAHIRQSGKRVVNITSEPIAMEAIRARFFPSLKIGPYDENAPAYHVEGDPDYSLTRAEVFDEMGEFLAGNT
jgi:nucleoside-diphosphate-sugar epimerase